MANKKPVEMTQERLKQIFSYDPETGEFARLKHVGGARKKAEPVRYRAICIDGAPYLAHRMAWLYMTGEMPSRNVDHINRDPSDNRWCNLRLVTQQQNMWNAIHPTGKTRLRGVSKVNNKYRASVHNNNKRVHIGYFSSAEAAAEAVLSWCRKVRGEFNAEGSA